MREVTVIASAHKKQPYVVDRQACNKIGPPESNKKDCETGQMCRQKRQRSQQRYPFAVAQYDCAGCHAADLLSSERSEPLQALSFCRFTPADFHDLSPRGFHHHSPTPGFCFLSFYQFSPFVAIIPDSFSEAGSDRSP